jgi:enamine deaminase RidA (YjgF/YER057c/UK114 family)
MDRSTPIVPVDVPHLKSDAISQAVRAGDVIAVSGQVALGADGRVVGEADSYAQAEQTFDNLEAVLHAAGAGLDDIISLTCYLVGPEHYPAYAAVRARRLGPHRPAGTAVIVAGLLDPRFLMEVQALAVVPSPGS